jgi:Fe-S cluster assembly ATP-binding protein
MIKIKNLHVSVEGREILKGLNLEINAGEVHAVMGPNGSGKSTLAAVIAGREDYQVTSGEIIYKGENIIELAPEERAQKGIFLAFQYPVEIPGISNATFLKEAINSIRRAKGLEILDSKNFLQLMKEKMAVVNMDKSMMQRSVNEGFSGGEKKRNEIFQMAMLEPAFCVLDETDSGLDIDALRIVANGVNSMRHPERSFLVITHYQRLLDYIVPDFVHVLFEGRIVKSGPKELALELEEKGYDWIKREVAV